MTCQELRSYYEDPVRVASSSCLDSAEAAAHAAGCAECSRFVETQRDLETGLRPLRESVPQLSASLDAAVLANYRKHMAEHPSSVNSTPARRRRSSALLRWSAALAAIVVVAVIVSSSGRFFSGKKNVTTIAEPSAAPPAAVPKPTDTDLRGSKVSTVTKPGVSHAAVRPLKRRHSAPAEATLGNPLPVGFRSLMYCDELSCSGAMEMIRVQLPSSAFMSPSARMNTNDVVFADVLVGSDGIARGIRIVE